MPDNTSTTTRGSDAVDKMDRRHRDSNPDARDGRLLYIASSLPRPVGFAVCHGSAEDLIGWDDMPVWNGEDGTRAAWTRDVHAMLQEKGVLDSYRAHLTMNATPATCPPWCVGEHPLLIDSDTKAICHEQILAIVPLPDDMAGEPTGPLKLSLVQWQDIEDGMIGQPVIFPYGTDDIENDYTPATMVQVGKAFILAGERAAEILGASHANDAEV